MSELTLAERQSRRNVWILVAAQAILGAQMPLHFTIGGLSGQMLATDKCWATLPISMTVLGSMLTAPWLSSVMQRLGRRPGFLIGAAGGTLGAAMNAYALWIGSFPLLLVGSLFIGIYMSAQGFFRFAAADTAKRRLQAKGDFLCDGGGARLGNRWAANGEAYIRQLRNTICRGLSCGYRNQRGRLAHLHWAEHPKTQGKGSQWPSRAVPARTP